MENSEKVNYSSNNSKEMDRRKFCKSCVSCTTGIILLTGFGISDAVASLGKGENVPLPGKKEMRKLFMKKGSCAHLLFYLLNREYGHNDVYKEKAIDQLAGGIAERGYQCGMLWGSSMGAAGEAFRQSKSMDHAMVCSLYTTREIIDAFVKLTKSPDCSIITNIDLTKRFSKIKMVFSAGDCFDLAHKWAPKAIKTTHKSLSDNNISIPENMVNCASEVVRRMGGSEEDMVLVSGFAGGLGLSGNGCGALSAALWMKSLEWCRENPKKRGYAYKGVQEIMTLFENETKGELLCSKISGTKFNSLGEHARFIQNGGCKEIIHLLSKTKTTVT